MKTKKRMRSISAVTLWISCAMLLVWVLSMFAITIATAESVYHAFYRQCNEFADYIDIVSRFDWIYGDDDALEYMKSTPGNLENNMLSTIRSTNTMRFNQGWRTDTANILRNEDYMLQTAVIFLDKDGNVIHESGDFIFFSYASEDVWNAGEEDGVPSGYAWFGLDYGAVLADPYDPYDFFRVAYAGLGSLYDIIALRITGHMNGAEIIPVKMSYATQTGYSQAMEDSGLVESYIMADGTIVQHFDYSLSDVDRTGFLDWQLMFDNTASAQNKDDLITIYARYPAINIYDAGGTVNHHREEDSLYSLLSSRGYRAYSAGNFSLCIYEYKLNSIIVGAVRQRIDFRGYDFTSNEPIPEPDFVVLSAISCNPLSYAISNLRNVYIISFLLAFIVAIILRQVIKRGLTQPLEAVNKGIADGWTRIRNPEDTPQRWREPFELFDYYDSTRDKLSTDRNEVLRLRTALEYAKKAEESRRQMASNIAHELKTPLAVIHSYSEGLKERIAEDKRELYLDVILTESERMDAMVLEMLDLSRLEAGKVTLARDDFSLAELARAVFSKFELVISDKSLELSFDFDGECNINADESRISQVVMNFASNAVKYSPTGGSILVRAGSVRGKTRFSVENESEPLSGEQLAKVWDAFFRADDARSDGGSGLGLAITKSIIILHGGECFARNTDSGVEFGFSM